MLRKFGFFVVFFGLALPVLAADSPSSISGYVRRSAGVPQMGAAVEVLNAAARTLKVFTDENGFYSIHDLLPGNYSLKVTAPSFLPALRDRIGLRAGSTMMVNVTLNTLFEAIQLGPLRGPAEDDDWKWTLRSMANRPVLRVLDDGSSVTQVKSSGEGEGHDRPSRRRARRLRPSPGGAHTQGARGGRALLRPLCTHDQRAGSAAGTGFRGLRRETGSIVSL